MPNHVTKAVVLGATGLVGKTLIQECVGLTDYDEVLIWCRSPLPEAPPFDHPKVNAKVMDFERLEKYGADLHQAHVYVCFGTTIKKAGSREAFRRVDYNYVLDIAQLAAEHHAASFVWISSVGADADSTNFYLRVKGELEQAIFAIVELKSATVRPSLLLGQRQEFRLGERLGILLSPLLSPFMQGPLAKYRPIQARDVAKQMIAKQLNLTNTTP